MTTENTPDVTLLAGVNTPMPAHEVGEALGMNVVNTLELQVELTREGWLPVAPGNKDNDDKTRRAIAGLLTGYNHDAVAFTMKGVYYHRPSVGVRINPEVADVVRIYYTPDPDASKEDFWSRYVKTSGHARARGFVSAKRRRDVLERQMTQLDKMVTRLEGVREYPNSITMLYAELKNRHQRLQDDPAGAIKEMEDKIAKKIASEMTKPAE